MIMVYLSFLVVGFLLGYNFLLIQSSLSNKRYVKRLNKKFEEVLSNIDNNKSQFKTRFSNVVYIDTRLEGKGAVTVVYIIDRSDVSIFKGNRCIYTSNSIKKDTINKIISSINNKHGKDINDVVNLFGLVMNRKDFEKAVGDSKINLNQQVEKSDIEKIIIENKSKFDIDEILDKISSIGMESLTKEEKDFLENYSDNGNKS